MKKKKQGSDQTRQIFGHQKLERRRLLNADFSFTGGVLELSNFVDSDAGANEILFEQIGADSYELTLSDGVFAKGTDTAAVSGLGTDTLLLDNSMNTINSILTQSTTADVFNVEFGEFAFDGDIIIEQDGGAAFGNVSQQADASLESAGTLEITGVDNIALDNTDGNDFGTISIQNADTVSLAEINDVDVSTIEATGDVTVTSGGNVTLTNAMIGGELDISTSSGNIDVDAIGDLVLDDIVAEDGSVAVSATGDIEIGSIDAVASTPANGTVNVDSSGGSINDLQDDSLVDIQASGTIELNAQDEIGGMPSVSTAADTAGRIEFAAASELTMTSASENIVIAGIGDLTLADVDASGSVDVVTSGDLKVGLFDAGDDGTLLVDGNLTFEDTVTAGGSLLFDVTGDVSQIQTGSITATGLALQVEGNTILVDATNNVQRIAAENVGATHFANAGDLEVDLVTTGDPAVTIGGITTSDRDVRLVVAGNLTFEQAVTLNSGDLLLDVDGDVSQRIAGTITAAGLGLMVDGETILQNANDIEVLAADNNGATQVNNIDDLEVNRVNVGVIVADRAMNGQVQTTRTLVEGVTTSNDDVKLTTSGNLSLERAVDVGAGDLFLNVNGDLTQRLIGTIDASGLGLMVSGETILQRANAIDVLAVDSGGATQINVVDDLSVGTVTVEVVTVDRAMNGQISTVDMSIDGISTRGDDVKLSAAGNIGIEQAIDLGGGSLLLDVDGDVSQIEDGTITSSGLGLMVEGETELVEANDIDVLAINSNGITRFSDVDGYDIDAVTTAAFSADRAMAVMNGSVDAAAMSISGITTSNDDVKLTAAAGDVTLRQKVDVGSGALFLDVVGNVSQLPNGTISAANLGLVVTEDVTLTNAANDIDNLAANVGGTLSYTDADEIVIASLECDGEVITGITAAGDLNIVTNDGSVLQNNDAPLMIGGNASFNTGAGDICLTNLDNAFTGDLSLINTGDIVLATSGVLNLTPSAVASGGSLRFIADQINIATDIIADQLVLQASVGVELIDTFTIDVTDLLLAGDGDFELVNAGGNLVDNLAVDVDGDVTLNNATAINIGNLSFVSNCGNVAISGVNVDAGDFELTTADADITQAAAITVDGITTVNAGTGNIKLNGADRIAERSGTSDDTTPATLNGDGFNDNDFNQINATGSTVEIFDVNDMRAGEINAVNNVFLRAGDTDLASGELTLVGDLTTSAVNGQVLLQSDTEISQIARSVVSSNDLLVGSSTEVEFQTGDVDLDGANQVNQLAVRLNDNFRFVNAIDLTISTVNYVSSCTTELQAGINVAGDASLVVDGNFTVEQTASVDQNLLLDVRGDVSQLPGQVISATGLALRVDGNTILNNAFNDVDQIAASNGGATQFNDANDLKVGSVETVHSAGPIDGVTSSDDNFKLSAAGNLTLEEQADIGAGNLVLDVGGDVSQLAAGTINAAGLGLVVAGETVLNQANDVDVLATTADGATQFSDINDLKVGAVSIEAASADRAMAAMNGTIDASSMSIVGITTSNDDFKIAAGGNLTLEEAVNVGQGDLLLDVDGDASQIAAGRINAVGLGLTVAGETVLNAANDIEVLAANNESAVFFNDTNDLRIGTVNAEAVSADRAMNGTIDADAASLIGVATSGDDVQLVAAGTVTFEESVSLAAGDLFLDVDTNVLQTGTGTIDAARLGLLVTGETVLNAANDINVLAANNDNATQVNVIGDLAVGTVTAEAISADRAMLAMNGTVNAAEVELSGVTTTDDDVKLAAGGDMDIQRAVNLGAGDLLFDVDGAVAQQFSGTIQASGLGLMVGGNSILNNVANDVDRIAAANGGDQGAIQFIDANSLNVGIVTIETVAADPATVRTSIVGITVDSLSGTSLTDANFTDQIDLLGDTVQTQQLDGEPIFNPNFNEYLTGLGDTNDGAASSVGIALMSEGELRASQEIISNSDVFLTNASGDISINRDVVAAVAGDKILIVAADELNLNAQLLRSGSNGSVLDVSNLNPTLSRPAILLNPSDSSSNLSVINGNALTQSFEYTFGQVGEQNFTTTVFFGILADAYAPLSVLAPDFEVLDFLVPQTVSDLNELLFDMGVEDFQSRSVFANSDGGQSLTSLSQPINGPNDLLPLSTATDRPAGASFSTEFVTNNPNFRNVAFVFNDAGINIFDNAAAGADELRDLNVAVEDFQGISNFGSPPLFTVEQEESQTIVQLEETSFDEPEFFPTVLVTDEPLFTQTVQEKFFVVVYFESQAEADNFEAAFEGLETSETGEIDYERLQELLEQFDSLEFKTDDEDEALDVNKIRQIFEKAELDLDGDDDEWQEAFQDWLKRKQIEDEAPEVPRGVYKIIEVENGRAIIQGDDVDRRFVPESNDQQQTEDYPFDVPADDVSEADRIDGAATPPMSARMSRWVAILDGKNPAENRDVESTSDPVRPTGNAISTSVVGAATIATSAVGLLGLVAQRNAASSRTAADEIEDFAIAKSNQPERNVFSKAARFYRRNRRVLQDDNQD